MENDFWTKRRWLARLSFTFLIMGLWLLLIAYKGAKEHTITHSRMVLCYISAGLAFSLFLAGTRARHKDRDE